MANPNIQWGILGPGNIAANFARSLKNVSGCTLRAVASSQYLRAHGFANEHGAEKVYGAYREMLDDPELDIVYIATPHCFHAEQIRMCLEAGKHVLCEKPITTSAAELEPLMTLAAGRNLFLMEGMWSRFFPSWHVAKEWIQAGKIGEPRMAEASFCFRAPWKPEGRLLNPDLAGGALWDVGIYTLAFSTFALGTDLKDSRAFMHRGETGVDEESALLLRFGKGETATLTCSIRTETPHIARIHGTEGSIQLPAPFWKADRVTLHTGNAVEESYYPYHPPGFQFEIAHVRECLRQGKTESPEVPLAESLLWQRVIDRAREENGFAAKIP